MSEPTRGIQNAVEAMAKGGCVVLRSDNLAYELTIPVDSSDEFRHICKMLIILSENLDRRHEHGE